MATTATPAGTFTDPADDFGCQKIIITQPECDVEHDCGDADRDGNGQRDSGDDEPADTAIPYADNAYNDACPELAYAQAMSCTWMTSGGLNPTPKGLNELWVERKVGDRTRELSPA